jgi:hypothetical protein
LGGVVELDFVWMNFFFLFYFNCFLAKVVAFLGVFLFFGKIRFLVCCFFIQNLSFICFFGDIDLNYSGGRGLLFWFFLNFYQKFFD